MNKTMIENASKQNRQFDDRQVIELLDRLEAAKKVLDQGEEIEETIRKLNNLEFFLRRFGTIKELASHMLFVERKMYMLKEYLTVQEAADFLGLSSSQIYKMTSKHEVPVYKPNGKTVFLRRDDLNRWMSKNKVLSEEEMEEYAMTQMTNLSKRYNHKIK